MTYHQAITRARELVADESASPTVRYGLEVSEKTGELVKR